MKTKVAFFGTSDKSLPILEVLHKHFDLMLCVTKDDTVVGRKKEIRQTSVKKWAIKNNVDYISIKKLQGKELAKLKRVLLSKSILLGIVADFSFIIPSEIIDTFKLGLLNVHFSLLPKYRGASPVQHTIINGDEITGVTFLLTDEDIDTGNIIFQVKYRLTGKETTQQLQVTLFELSAKNLPIIIKKHVSGGLKPKKQNHKNATYCYSPSHPKSTLIYKEDAKIDWDESESLIERRIRAYYPWPIAWTTLSNLEKTSKVAFSRKHKSKDLKVKIYEAVLYQNKKIQIKKLQVEGKNVVSWNEFKNGYANIF